MSQIFQKTKSAIGFPHIKIFILIVFLAFIALILAVSFHKVNMEFIASIMVSVFAGLMTGFTISVVSSVKRITKVKLGNKKIWLMAIKEKFLDYMKCRDELISVVISEDEEESCFDYFDKVVYCAEDVISCVYSLNEAILQANKNEAICLDANSYCMENYSYNASSINDDLGVIQKRLQNYMANGGIPKKQVLLYFKGIHSKIVELNLSISKEMREIEIREIQMTKTFF